MVVMLLTVSNLMLLAAAVGDGGHAKTVRVGYVNFENYQEGGEGEYKRGFGYEYLQRVAYGNMNMSMVPSVSFCKS